MSYNSCFISDDTKGLINAMKEVLGDALDETALQALEVSAAMKAAGANDEEIEEMMAMIMNKGGGISEDFISSIKQAMETGSKHSFEALLKINNEHTFPLRLPCRDT